MKTKSESAEERKKRLAKALKANIGKRKVQAKRRVSATSAPEPPEKQ